MSKTYLKVKIKSLAAEASIIRHEEKKWKDRTKPGNKHEPSPIYFGLHEHRVYAVRREARVALLAYGFIRGREYRSIEAKNKHGRELPQTARIAELVTRYGRPDSWKDLKTPERVAKISEWTGLQA
jgi:hypothetical protein